MEPLQGPVEGVFLKLIIDALRSALPALDGRWVHLLVLAGAIGMTLGFHWYDYPPEQMLSHCVTVFLAAIGTNEVASRGKENLVHPGKETGTA